MSDLASLSLNQLIEAALTAEQGGSWPEAASLYAAARRLQPGEHRLVANQANALWLADLPEAALACYEAALAMDPGCPLSRRGKAHCLRDLNRFEEAEALHHPGLPPDPDPFQAAWAHSQLLIGLERYRQGFESAEGRLRNPEAPGPVGDPMGPGDLEVVSEQGFGDTFQFCRWLPLLQRRRREGGVSGAVRLLVDAPLVGLLREGLAWMDDPPQVLPKPAALEGDRQHVNIVSLMSLPHRLGGAPLAEAVPYLRSPLWQGAAGTLLPPSSGTLSPPLRVGLLWAAGRKLDHPFTAREYRKRSLTPSVLWQLTSGLVAAGAQLVPLQWGEDAEMLAGLDLPTTSCRLSLQDFAVTARLLQALDLVVTVDTAMAHLVGAMGRPGWVLLPWSADPRWLRDRSDSPWYPSLRLFRQPRSGDWRAVIDAVLETFGPSFRKAERTVLF